MFFGESPWAGPQLPSGRTGPSGSTCSDPRANLGVARRLPPRARPQWGRPRSDGRKDWCPAPRRARDPKPRERAVIRWRTPPTPPPQRGGGVEGAVLVWVGGGGWGGRGGGGGGGGGGVVGRVGGKVVSFVFL